MDLPSSPDEPGPTDLDPIMDEALLWFTRLRAVGVSIAEQQDFRCWHDADVRHAEAYQRVVSLWDSPQFAQALTRHSALTKDAQPDRVQAPTRLLVRPVRRWPRRLAACATLAICAVLLTQILDVNELTASLRADYHTTTGMQEQVTLADGSSLTLNTGSALALDYQPARRGVRLLKGEAYFNVKTAANRPFEVEAGLAQVHVTGTAFSLRRSGADTVLSVRHGSVQVHATVAPDHAINLTRNQQLRISPDGLGTVQRIDPSLVFAWLDGRFIFRERPLAEVLTELDRYHPGFIVVNNPRLRRLKVSGNYKLDQPAAIVASLAEITSARVLHLSDYLLILR